jgi:hypothetical protein
MYSVHVQLSAPYLYNVCNKTEICYTIDIDEFKTFPFLNPVGESVEVP